MSSECRSAARRRRRAGLTAPRPYAARTWFSFFSMTVRGRRVVPVAAVPSVPTPISTTSPTMSARSRVFMPTVSAPAPWSAAAETRCFASAEAWSVDLPAFAQADSPHMPPAGNRRRHRPRPCGTTICGVEPARDPQPLESVHLPVGGVAAPVVRPPAGLRRAAGRLDGAAGVPPPPHRPRPGLLNRGLDGAVRPCRRAPLPRAHRLGRVLAAPPRRHRQDLGGWARNLGGRARRDAGHVDRLPESAAAVLAGGGLHRPGADPGP